MNVPTPVGSARLLVHPALGIPRATLVLGHGAGRGADTHDLLTLAARLPRDGVRVVLVEQPWVLAGRRVAAPPAQLDTAWDAAIAAVDPAPGPTVWGGRSAGARVAARRCTEHPQLPGALLLLAFPLHPPGRPDRSRLSELLGAARTLPVVVVQGERDPFGTAAELREALGDGASDAVVVRPMPGAGHGLAPAATTPLTAGEADDILVAAALQAVGLAGNGLGRAAV